MENESVSHEDYRRMSDSPAFSLDAASLEALERKVGEQHDLDSAFVEISGLIEQADLGEKEKETLAKLLREAKESCLNYVRLVLEHTEVSEMELPADFSERRTYQLKMEEIDRRRRQAHLRYADALNILFRNMIKNGIKAAETLAQKFAGDPKDPTHRRRISELAMVYAWKKAREDLKESN